MIFKGIKFVRAKNIVSLPNRDENNNLMPYAEEGKENYITFGKITKLGEKKKGSFKTAYKMSGQNDFLYATVIEKSGYSLTNMLYGSDGYTYLMLDGNFFKSAVKRNTNV